jgi:hypothetical protein
MFTQMNLFKNLIIITKHPSLFPKIHPHLTHISHMKSIDNLKTTIPISFLTPHILFNLPIHHPKHPPLMKHPILPQLHPFMITQIHKYLHHQEYHHHLLPTHMLSPCWMSNHPSLITNTRHHHHLPSNT